MDVFGFSHDKKIMFANLYLFCILIRFVGFLCGTCLPQYVSKVKTFSIPES